MADQRWMVEMYEDADGRCPVRVWLDRLALPLRAAAVAAIELELGVDGIDVCRSSMGKNLGEGLYELRVAQDAPTLARRHGRPEPDVPPAKVLLRIFFATDGRKVILLAGYDKLAHSAPRRQASEIKAARKLLRSYRLEQQRLRRAR